MADPDAGPSAGHLLRGLSASQRAAVTSESGLLCVVAGAGSGKTTVLTRRVAWRVLSGAASPEHVLVVTFTRQAAAELRARLERLGVPGVWAATFHAAAYRLLRRHWADAGRRPPALVTEPERLLRRLLEDEPGADPALAPALAAEVSWARVRLVGPSDYPAEASRAGRRCPVPAEQVTRLFVRYDEEKRRRHVLDLDDLVLRAAELAGGDGPAATSTAWRVRHLFVDEFQDVNPAQWRLLEAWRQNRPDMFVVGDPRQAIYRFNGSDPGLLGRLPMLVPGTEVVRLDQNHRSSGQVVAAAASVLDDHEADGPDGAPWAAPDADGPAPLLRAMDDEGAEAAAVVRWLRTTRRAGQPWRQMAVLARTHARLGPVTEALEQVGIPFRRTASAGDRAMAELRRLLRSMDREMPLRAALVDLLAETEPAAAAGNVPEQDIQGAGTSCPPLRSRLERLAEEHAAEEDRPRVGTFLAGMAANRVDTDDDAADAVALVTFHQAKGLEWPAVAVIGLEEGTMPIAYASGAEALAEERRLLYVALTRARRHLWCSWAEAGPPGAGPARRSRGPSPFLSRLRAQLAGQGPPEPAAALTRVSELRRRLAEVG